MERRGRGEKKMADSKLEKFAALWKSETKAGEKYFSGWTEEGVKCMVFKNKWKNKENDPDFRIFLDPTTTKEVKKYTPKGKPESDKKDDLDDLF